MPTEEDRRSGDERRADRRLELIESGMAQLREHIGLINADRLHLRELLDAKFATLSTSVNLVLDRVTKVCDAIEDPSRFAAGRALAHDLSTMRVEVDGHDKAITSLEAVALEMKGALALARTLGVGTILTAGTTLVFILLRVFKVIP